MYVCVCIHKCLWVVKLAIQGMEILNSLNWSNNCIFHSSVRKTRQLVAAKRARTGIVAWHSECCYKNAHSADSKHCTKDWTPYPKGSF